MAPPPAIDFPQGTPEEIQTAANGLLAQLWATLGEGIPTPGTAAEVPAVPAAPGGEGTGADAATDKQKELAARAKLLGEIDADVQKLVTASAAGTADARRKIKEAIDAANAQLVGVDPSTPIGQTQILTTVKTALDKAVASIVGAAPTGKITTLDDDATTGTAAVGPGGRGTDPTKPTTGAPPTSAPTTGTGTPTTGAGTGAGTPTTSSPTSTSPTAAASPTATPTAATPAASTPSTGTGTGTGSGAGTGAGTGSGTSPSELAQLISSIKNGGTGAGSGDSQTHPTAPAATGNGSGSGSVSPAGTGQQTPNPDTQQQPVAPATDTAPTVGTDPLAVKLPDGTTVHAQDDKSAAILHAAINQNADGTAAFKAAGITVDRANPGQLIGPTDIRQTDLVDLGNRTAVIIDKNHVVDGGKVYTLAQVITTAGDSFGGIYRPQQNQAGTNSAETGDAVVPGN